MVWTSPVFIKDCHLSHKCGFSLLPDRGAPPLPVYHFLCKICNTWQSNMSPSTTTQRWGGGGFRLVWTSWSVTTTSKTLHIIKKNTILKERISSKTIKIRPMFVYNRLKNHLCCGDSLRWSGRWSVFGGIRASTLWTAVSKTWPCESCWVRTRCWGPAGRGRSPAWPGLQHPCLGSEGPASSLWGPASPDSSHPAQNNSRLDQFSAEALLKKCLNLQWWSTAWSSHTPSSSCDRLWPAAPPETPSSARSHSPETASLKSRRHKPGKNLFQ